MRILFLTSRFPYPPLGGDRLRAYHIIKHLLKQGHEVDLLSLSDSSVRLTESFPKGKVVFLGKSSSYLNCLRGLFSREPLQIWYFRSAEMRKAVRNVLDRRRHHLIFCHLIRTAQYADDTRWGIPGIIDMTDAISLNYERVSNSIMRRLSLKKFIYAFEKERVLRYEREVMRSFDKCILISEKDKEYLKKTNDSGNLEVVPNGIDLNKFAYFGEAYDRNSIVFLGNMRTVPNEDAVFYFIKEVFPLIKKELPSARFTIIGDSPTKGLLRLAGSRPDIHITGYVEDVRKFLNTAALSVAPMRLGAGMQNKILESMSVGVPVITTSIGLEGLSACPGKEILVEDSPELFAKQAVKMMKEGSFRRHISLEGRQLVEKIYSWENALKRLDGILHELVPEEKRVRSIHIEKRAGQEQTFKNF